MAYTDRSVLPDSLVPVHYEISLTDLLFNDPWTYHGLVKIHVKVQRSTRMVILNTKKLELQDTRILVDGKLVAESSTCSYDPDEQRATIALEESIPEGDALIAINFIGCMNFDMCGFYRSKYKSDIEPTPGTAKDNEGNYYMFSTQFEACDARQAFPCFDEPNLKATFDISLEVPGDQVVISNMPIKQSAPGKQIGTKLVSFERTPPMSTYLAAWAIGDFNYIETFSEREYNGAPIPVRVYATRGLEDQGHFALDHAYKIIDLFSKTFGSDYPIPKADMLAVHDFAQGAMENWGLITYRAIDVLYDPEKSDAARQNRIAYVVAHELAHQWFGNLVTMNWWDELWLNESFATWVGWWASDYLHPDWNIWDQFLVRKKLSAFGLDSLRASHPIHVPVKDALEVDQIFDVISYNKGSAVLRMLADYIGIDAFFEGIGIYLQKHAYGNASTSHLWAALSEASGKDITAFIDPWVRKIGFPYLTVVEEPGQIAVKQSRFLACGDVKPEEDDTIWSIPLNLRTKVRVNSARSALSTRAETIQDIDEDFYLLNAGQKGFCRINYPPARLVKLGQAHHKLETSDKIGLITDASAMAFAGFGTTAGLLSLLEGFQNETSYMTWSAISDALGRCRYIFSHNKKILNGLKQFALKLVSPAAEQIGLEFERQEVYLTTMLRKLLLSMAAGAGHKEIIAGAQERFQKWMSGDPHAFRPSARAFVFFAAVANGGQAEWEAVKNEYLTTNDMGAKATSLEALGRTKSPELTQKYLHMTLSNDVKPQNMHSIVLAISRNNETRELLWEFTKEKWGEIFDRFGQNKVVLEKWIKCGFDRFSDPEKRQQVQEFFENKDIRGIDRALFVAYDLIDANAQYRQRDEKLVLDWLEAHGYA